MQVRRGLFFALLLCVLLEQTIGYVVGGVRPAWLRSQTRRRCVEKTVTPIERKGGDERQDSDSSWRTKDRGKVVPIPKDRVFTQRPELITFDAFNTLIQPSQSIGKWYREALNTVCEMTIRLPRPAHFTQAFEASFEEMSKTHPCFGATTELTSKQWWFEVVRKTYATTKDLTQIEPEEMEKLLPAVFEMLYTEVFGSKEGWVVKEDVTYVLQKLVNWRDQGAGPKIGIVSNFDDRLPTILEELGIAKSFDFVLTSSKAKAEKPGKGIFDEALKLGACSSPKAAFHVGDSIRTDVAGALAAGWTPLRYNEWFDEEFPDWTDIETEQTAQEGAERGQAALQWGRREVETGLEWVEIWGLDDVLSLFGFPEDEEKLIKTTLLKGVYED